MPDTRSRAVRPRPDGEGAAPPDPEVWGIPPRGTRLGGAPAGGRPLVPPGLLDGLADRLRNLRGDGRLAVVGLVALALVAGLVWYRVGAAGGSSGGGSSGGSSSADADVAAPPEPAPGATSPAGAPTGTPGAPVGEGGDGGVLTIHVAGAVSTPGVIELPAGARVIDAVEAAGGGLPEADLDRMNLAAPIVDGQRILVQRVGDPPAPADPTTAGAPGTGASPDGTTGPINLNTATQEQLELLPGIGPVLAQAIITERDQRGGFRSVNELRDVRGIGDKRFADIEALVTV